MPVSASRNVTKALLGSFDAAGAEEMAQWIAEVAAFADKEGLPAGILTMSCSVPGVFDNEVDLAASNADILAMSFSSPESCTGEPTEATLASPRL